MDAAQRNQAGKTTEAYVLFAAPGGMQISRRSISPRQTASSFSISSR